MLITFRTEPYSGVLGPSGTLGPDPATATPIQFESRCRILELKMDTSRSGKITSRYFAMIKAKNKNLAERSGIRVFVVGFSRIRALQRTYPTHL